LLASLRQCVLQFTQRLHRAEIDRHGLHTQLLQHLPRHSGLVEMPEYSEHHGLTGDSQVIAAVVFDVCSFQRFLVSE